MSLRKSPELSPELLAAKRANAQLSTGPSTPSGKQNSKLNALKHGVCAAFDEPTMLALGEDPEEFDDLKKELRIAYGPGDTLWERQIDDLARLYWRRQRLQRALEGLMRRAMLAVEEGQRRRRQEIVDATFDASRPEALDIDMTAPADPGVRLRLTFSLLEVIREQIKQRAFRPRQASALEALYKARMGWRQARLVMLLRQASESAQGGAPDEAQYQELLRSLDEEIARVGEEFEYEEMMNEEKAAIERDAALAPVGETWDKLAWREGAMDRAIDRKVRILVTMRRDFARSGLAATLGELDDDGRMRVLDTVLRRKAPPGATGFEQAEWATPASEPEATRAHHRRTPSSKRKGVEEPAPLLADEEQELAGVQASSSRHGNNNKSEGTKLECL